MIYHCLKMALNHEHQSGYKRGCIMIKAGYILSIVMACMCSMAAQAQSAEPIQIGLEVVAEGLTAPVFLTHSGDGSGRLFIVDQAGQIRVVKDDVLLPLPFLDISSRMV